MVTVCALAQTPPSPASTAIMATCAGSKFDGVYPSTPPSATLPLELALVEELEVEVVEELELLALELLVEALELVELEVLVPLPQRPCTQTPPGPSGGTQSMSVTHWTSQEPPRHTRPASPQSELSEHAEPIPPSEGVTHTPSGALPLRQTSGEGQSRVSWHCWLHTWKAHTSGGVQSELRVHAAAGWMSGRPVHETGTAARDAAIPRARIAPARRRARRRLRRSPGLAPERVTGASPASRTRS
jgi:hypothetical protein